MKQQPRTGSIGVFGTFTPDAYLNIQVPPHLREQFKELVHRATNLWPDASPEIKEFADIITNGEVLQDYHRQDFSPAQSPAAIVPANTTTPKE